MSLPLKITLSFGFASALLVAGMALPGQAASPRTDTGLSPALCGPGDIREPGIQGDVPAGQTGWKYNCGVRLVGQLPRAGQVQGVGKCAYVRVSSGNTGGTVYVIDVSDPANPKEVRSVPVKWASETMRVVVTKERAVLVSGSSVYDIRDCLNPVLKGEIQWPPVRTGGNPPAGGGGGSGQLPHDLRVNHAGTKVYASFGLWEADISNLDDPKSWKITDYRCELATQQPGPWKEFHRLTLASGVNLCEDSARNNWTVAGTGLQLAAMWPTIAHGLDASGDGRRVYVGNQAGGTSGRLAGDTRMRVIDMTQRPVKIVGEAPGPGHSVDWFRTGGRDYVLHANEGGTGGAGPPPGAGGAGGAPGGSQGRGPAQGGAASTPGGAAPAPGGAASMMAAALQGMRSDTCKPYPRSTALGWAFEAILSDVTGDKARNVSMLKIAINNPENCQARKASGRDPTVAYHLIDNPYDAHFAAVNFGSAGLRIFDIRQPTKPSEVAYFNHGPLVHSGVGYYDAARGLIYAAGSSGFWVLEVEPQVKARLGL